MAGILPMLRAVTLWDGPRELKHFLLTLCSLADHVTGKGIYGHPAISKAMGGKDDENGARTVRRLFDRLKQCASSPVQVQRRARMRTDGKGRTSDEWTLYLATPTGLPRPVSNNQPDTGDRLDLQPTGHGSPVSGEANDHDQPDTKPRPTGHEQQDQPDSGVRVSESGDRNLLSESDLSAPPTAPQSSGSSFALETTEAEPEPKKPTKAKSSTKPKPKPETVGYNEVVVAYFEAYAARRGATPLFDGADGRAVKRLLKQTNGNADVSCMIIRNAFADGFWGPQITIRKIASDPSRFLTVTPQRPGARKSGVSQPGANERVQYDDGFVGTPREHREYLECPGL